VQLLQQQLQEVFQPMMLLASSSSSSSLNDNIASYYKDLSVLPSEAAEQHANDFNLLATLSLFRMKK
jgi:hypothetical protein